MAFFLSKFLLFLIRPLVWVMAIALYALFSKNKRHKRKALIFAVALLYFFSNKFFLGQVAYWYEAKQPALAHYDVGLLLGGFSSYNFEAKALKAQFAGDRLTQTLRLYQEGKIDRILMSGGSGSLLEGGPPEALYTGEYLKALKIPDSAVIMEKESRNTKENFKYAAEILKGLRKADAKILVITSAWHIPRTKLLAEKQGFKHIDFYPTNSLSEKNSFEDYLVPQGSAILGWELLIKEWVGYVMTWIGLT